MSSPEIDSPFTEKKSNPLVWIIPSVALHIIVLIVWLTLPEEAPREPTNRKMTINSAQAEQLQQHVEDTNLVVLQAQVRELQAIKQAMAQIRESKMSQLRSFEADMVVAAPKDATELFTRLVTSQTKIIEAYKQMLESTRASIAIEPTAQVLIENKQIKEVRPQLIEFKALRTDIHAQMNMVKNEITQNFALINTAEVALEWVSNPTIENQLSDLKAALEVAQKVNHSVADNFYKSLPWRSAQNLNDIITKGEEYAQFIESYTQANVDGKLAVEAKRAKQQEEITAAQTAIDELKEEQLALTEKIASVAKGDKATLNPLNAQAKEMRTRLINLGKARGNAEKILKKIGNFRPNHNDGKRINSIYSKLNGIFVEEPSLELMGKGMAAQVEFAQASQSFLAALVEQMPQGEAVQP